MTILNLRGELAHTDGLRVEIDLHGEAIVSTILMPDGVAPYNDISVPQLAKYIGTRLQRTLPEHCKGVKVYILNGLGDNVLASASVDDCKIPSLETPVKYALALHNRGEDELESVLKCIEESNRIPHGYAMAALMASLFLANDNVKDSVLDAVDMLCCA